MRRPIRSSISIRPSSREARGGPLEHVIAAKAICFGEALKPEFKTYQEQVLKNAKALAEALKKQGFKILTGGTDNHLMLLDLRGMDVSGKELQNRCDEVYITLNKNTVPNDPRSPFVTSGVRIGTRPSPPEAWWRATWMRSPAASGWQPRISRIRRMRSGRL